MQAVCLLLLLLLLLCVLACEASLSIASLKDCTSSCRRLSISSASTVGGGSSVTPV
jgi:hypothetical protein